VVYQTTPSVTQNIAFTDMMIGGNEWKEFGRRRPWHCPRICMEELRNAMIVVVLTFDGVGCTTKIRTGYLKNVNAASA
jgi:hypothetical protein